MTTDELKALLAETTPGPWKTHLVDDTSIVSSSGVDVATTCDSSNAEREDAYNVEYERMEADARLIVLAPTLAAEVIALREREARLVGALRKLACLGNGDRPGNSDGNMIARAALAEIEKEAGE